MFVLKSLGRLVLGNTEQRDLLALENGRLLVRNLEKDKTKTTNDEEYFKSATLVLRRGDAPFQYYLQCRDDEQVEADEVFPIDPQKLHFAKSVTEAGQTSFEWRAGELQFVFEVDSETSPTTIEMFFMTMAQCQFESAKRKAHSTATDSDLDVYLVTKGPQVKLSAAAADDVIVFETETMAGWYVFDPNTGLFQTKAEHCRPTIVKDGKSARKHQSFLSIASPDDPQTILHRQPIDPDATHHTDRSSSSFVWCMLSESGYIFTFSLRFQSPAAVMAFSNAVGQAIYETLNESEMDAADQKYLLSPFAMDVEMRDAPPLEVDTESDSESDSETDDAPTTSKDQEKWFSEADSETITNLAVGYKHDRSFVAKGATLGVFKHTGDDRLEPYTTVNSGFQTITGKHSFTPSQMMLHQEDSNLLLINPEDPHSIYKMDLNVGKVVEEWGVQPDVAVTSLVPSAKYSQMTGESTLIGLNDNSLFRLDPRLSGRHKRVDAETKSYVVKNRFSCGATTGKGELAVASAKGDIRLFNKLDKRAKTLLPGFGDAILGIDVTESGRWIVATCKTYLLLINTEINGTDSLGFCKPMSDKPTPIRLHLKPEHVAYMNQPVSFTPARFSTGDSEERSIITSTGPFVVSWNFRRVKQGKLFDYQLKRYSDTIVADNFRFGQDRAMIVAMPHHVTMMTKKSLSSPSPRAFKSVDVVDKL